MIYKKGSVILPLVIVLGLLLFAFLWFNNGGELFRKQTPVESAAPAITNKTELDSAGKELDNMDLNQMDKELDQISSDSSGF